ncbi:MAG: hypothetical protein KAU50_01405 [Candidatus Marinimicrobia bacterium]|nr:hypothetical protein [Candidatus Neomarinimicrobiota bacterium]
MRGKALKSGYGLAICLALALSGAAGQRATGPKQAESSFKLAVQLEQAGNTEQAQAIYHQLVSDFPANGRYYHRYKRLLRNSAQYTELLSVLETHLSHFPNDLQSHIEVGGTYLQLGNRQMALMTWDNLLTTFADNLTAERLILSTMLSGELRDEGIAILKGLRAEKGDAGYFALELGRLHAGRMNYEAATDEFLRYLDAYPKAERNVASHLLRFPSGPELLARLRESLSTHGTMAAWRILSQVEFKYGNYEQVIQIYDRLDERPEEHLELARRLAGEREFDLAQQQFQLLLNNPAAAKLHEQALMGLASVFLARSRVDTSHLVLSGFYPDNRYFRLPFINVDSTRLAPLKQAMSLYDSLAGAWRNPRARLQLADIKYRILDDFDGAMADLKEVSGARLARQTQTDILLRKADVWIAKGDLVQAWSTLRRAQRGAGTKDQFTQIELKEVELLFLTGDRDSLLAHIGGLLVSLGPENPHFNDLLELSTLVRRFENLPVQYGAFIRAELLTRRNRRSEAAVILHETLEEEETAVSSLLQYRLAYLQTLLGDFTDAETRGLTISDETEFGELGLLMAAEIADYLLSDTGLASTRYLTFMESYPSSLNYHAVRLRYRELNPKEN